MARVSRKTIIMEEAISIVPERIYHVAAYVRLSVEDNKTTKEKESITMQQYLLENYIFAQPDMHLAGVFCDNGETGTDFARPGFEKMMEEVKKRNIDCIVVKDLSRFGRNYVETGYYLEKIFPYLGVRFVAVYDGYDSFKDTNGNEWIVSLKNLVNDLYAKDISIKSSSALFLKQKKGEFIGSFPPYGYLKSPENKHQLMIDIETAPVIQDIFLWRREGQGFLQIARRLNEKEIPSPAMYHYQKGHKKKKPSGTKMLWQIHHIRSVVQNPVYAGHMVQGKSRKSLQERIPTTTVPREEWIVVKHTHEAIIDQEIFDQVQEINRQHYNKSCALHGKYGSTENIWKGRVICSDCGTKMVRYKNVSSAGTIRYTFYCKIYAQNLEGKGCTKKWVGEPELKECILQTLQIQIQLAIQLETLLKQLQQQQEFQEQRKKLFREISQMQQKQKRNNTRRSSLFEAYCEHTLTETEYLSRKGKYEEEAQKLEETLFQLEQKKQFWIHHFSPQNEWILALKKYQNERVVTSKLVEELIQGIKVFGYNQIEIIWNFQDEFVCLAHQIEEVTK